MKRVILTIRFELVQPGKETKNTSTSISIYFLQEFLVFFFCFSQWFPHFENFSTMARIKNTLSGRTVMLLKNIWLIWYWKTPRVRILNIWPHQQLCHPWGFFFFQQKLKSLLSYLIIELICSCNARVTTWWLQRLSPHANKKFPHEMCVCVREPKNRNIFTWIKCCFVFFFLSKKPACSFAPEK